ncbi:MAG: ABC transporter permease [Planctomycetota bacterium]|nr:ABC transporter permease [Planctomycetota bacterium]
MSEGPQASGRGRSSWVGRAVEAIGRTMYRRLDSGAGLVKFIGGGVYLIGDTVRWLFKGLRSPEIRFGWENLWSQMVRVGVKSISIVVLVEVFIGIILALQMAPTLKSYGQIERVADIVAIAMFRELGPLLAGIVLSGFAGASIAAELGTMVEGEEIKALRATALNPIQYLVVPRVVATIVMLTLLTVIADIVGVFGGFLTGTQILNIDSTVYLSYTRDAITVTDFITGLIKAAVFGLMISIIACYEGLSVSGGAEGVGRATTGTVVKCIVALILADVVFTALFYAFGL